MFRNINIVDHDLLFLYILNSFVDFVFPFFPRIEFKSVEYLNSFCITTLLYWPPRPWVLGKTWTNTKRIITYVLIELFSNTTGMPEILPVSLSVLSWALLATRWWIDAIASCSRALATLEIAASPRVAPGDSDSSRRHASASRHHCSGVKQRGTAPWFIWDPFPFPDCPC